MAVPNITLPLVGQHAPAFDAHTLRGPVQFPAYGKGCWCIFFSHPANFTSAWTMYSTFLALKERWFDERNTKLLALTNEPVRQHEFSDKVRRYIGIYLKAPLIYDADYRIANLYGMASARRKINGFDRLAFIIDPEGVIQLILHNPLPSIECAVINLQIELDRLQGNLPAPPAPPDPVPMVEERPDHTDTPYPIKPAYFRGEKIKPN
jgi:alkyl hydroperoxide reductase subunit AhpC